jgi:hypothetical protein
VKVTVRDVRKPDEVIQDFPVVPHLGLPYVGTQLRLPRNSYQPRQPVVRVVDYVWDLVADGSGGLEVRMLVTDAD